MTQNIQPTIEMGAMTLVLLAKNYKSQISALLLKNGVTTPKNASEQEIALLMANLLKVSKSFNSDLKSFLQNPNVSRKIVDGMSGKAQYLNAVGDKYDFSQYDIGDFTISNPLGNNSKDTASSTSTNPSKGGFFSGLNLGELLNQGAGLFSSIDKNKTDRAIAQASANLGTSTGSTGGANTTDVTANTEKTGTSTTTIVVVSIVGIALIGVITYFIMKNKK